MKGYDSSLTESMPIPEDELMSDIYSKNSSWLEDEDEGVARKPNVFWNFQVMTTSEKKTANESDHISNPITPHKEILQGDNNSIWVNSSWEVVEGSSIVMEVESSIRTDSLNSIKNQTPGTDFATPDIEPLRVSRKSSDSKTATFTSNTGFKKPKEENKSENYQKSTQAKEGPFVYNSPNSEEDDYNSEEEFSGNNSNKNNLSNNGSQWAPSKEVNSVTPQDSNHIQPESSSQKSSKNDSLKNLNEDGWIGNYHGPSSTIDNNRGINDSQSSQKFESMSTHTSPQFQYHKKLLNKKKHKKTKKNGEYVSPRDFKKFLTGIK